MLQGLRNFVSRHRRKFLVTGIIIGGTYFALNYAQRKLIEFQERKAREFLERTRRMQHFESTERTCNQVILGVGAELYEVVLRECDLEQLVQRLRQKPANRLELWQELKIIAFTRVAAFVYCSALLVIALRVQLNLLGGYMYQDVTQQQQPKISDELKQQYLSLIRHFLEEGVQQLIKVIRAKVESVFQPLTLSQQLTLSDIEHLFWSLQMAINADAVNDPNAHMSKYLLPAKLPDHASALLQQMYNETMDVLEGDDAISICSSNIGRGFSLVMDVFADNWVQNDIEAAEKQQNADADAQNSTVNINQLVHPLAKIIPLITALTAKGFDKTTKPQNMATLLLTFFLVMEKCKTLGANVYESFCMGQPLLA